MWPAVFVHKLALPISGKPDLEYQKLWKTTGAMMAGGGSKVSLVVGFQREQRVSLVGF